MTNSLTTGPVAGVKESIDPAIAGVALQTDASGRFSATLPIGTYTLTFEKANFTSATQAASVVAGQSVTAKAVALKPKGAVVVNAGADVKGSPAGSVSLKAAVEALDGSQVTGLRWTQVSGPAVTIASPTSDATSVALPALAAFKAKLMEGLKVEDRFGVQAINPHALEAADAVTLKVTATTGSGTYSDTVNVAVALPYSVNGGLANVPVGVAVLVHGKKQAAYSWALTSPSGAKAALDDAAAQNPSFTPDVAGKYTLTESNSKASVAVYAGTWAGAISGQDAKGQPLSANCTACHNDKIAPDKFTAWKQSGHAAVFTDNINNPAGHWSVSCASCHTVGYNTEAKNGGFDEALETEGWKVPSHGDVGLWTTLLAKYPKTASLANIQCENCHGPNNSALHLNGIVDAARVSISSDVCGACHGEPLRHGRFQQWEESSHANFELAISRGTSASCGRCHSGQGFLAWLKQGDLTKPIQGAKGNATAAEMAAMGITAETAVPQTCAVCHEPHNVGTRSGEPNDVKLRVQGDTAMLPAGFKAVGVGRGALCITCHNTRNGARNDSTGTPPSYSAPHTAAQGDVLMGENAYFVSVGARSKHSFIENTCTTCHMELSPPPAEFSYNLSGTNHSFEASLSVCTSCHGAFNGGTLEESVEAKLHELGEKMSSYLLGKMEAQVHIKDYTPHTYQGKSYDVKSNDVTVDKANIAAIEATEPHGQQGFIIKFKTPVSFTYAPAGEATHSVTISEAEVQLGDITTDGTAKLIPLTDPLVKVGWNYFLIEGDGSEGVHNPSFTMDVLNASIAALK